MLKLIFWDVDTQYDFMMELGNLYVPDAESIIPNLEKLTQYARTHSIPILGSVDEHTEENTELSAEPDFQDTFPPHCIKGTLGQEKIDATKPRNPLWIESQQYDGTELSRLVKEHDGEIIFTWSLFSSTYSDLLSSTILEDELYPD